MACLSRHAVNKRSCFQGEMRFALDCARRVPFDQVYFVPARLENCTVPLRIEQQLEVIDLFPDLERSAKRLIQLIRHGDAAAARGVSMRRECPGMLINLLPEQSELWPSVWPEARPAKQSRTTAIQLQTRRACRYEECQCGVLFAGSAGRCLGGCT